MWRGSADGTFICDFRCVKGMVILAVTTISVTASHDTYGVYRAIHFRCVKGMVILAVTIVSVTASHDTYGVYRAIHFRFVWQLEPRCFDDRQ